MLIKKIFNFLSNFHYNAIYNYSKKLKFDVLIDVGSHQEEFISRFLNYKKIIFFCFEPNKKLFKKLYNKYRSNKRVWLFDYALGDNNSNKKLFLSNLNSLSFFNFMISAGIDAILFPLRSNRSRVTIVPIEEGTVFK